MTTMYSEKIGVQYWRTKSGAEVDFILGRGEVAVEVKGTDRVDKRELVSIKAFADSYAPRRALVVCNEKRTRTAYGITIIPWKMFLEKLWAGELIC